jgi:Cu-Zn family superoxide dismutase
LSLNSVTTGQDGRLRKAGPIVGGIVSQFATIEAIIEVQRHILRLPPEVTLTPYN